MSYIAHISEDGRIQTVKEHLLEVKNLAESYGKVLGVSHLAGLAGMLHDMGKFTEEFKQYIIEAVENPDAPPKRGSVDHSTSGGKLLYKLFHRGEEKDYKAIVAEIVGNAIISHHSYLQDILNPELESPYLKRVRDKDLPEYERTERLFFENVMKEEEFHRYVVVASRELEYFLSIGSRDDIPVKITFLTKFIFSMLIDADRTNTREFEEGNGNQAPERSEGELFSTYYNRLLEKIHKLKETPNANSPINLLRAEMSEQCEQFAANASGTYTLSIPTGGGKTLASLRYALKHTQHFDKKRIIYVVPFTTIIEQNAKEVRTILRDNENILEHHSNVIEDITNNDESRDGVIDTSQKLSLAKDNWDSPIIFTTMVQFLNVFYANGSRNIRRLHNLSEAVIIFDEVQKVPIHSVSLFNHALNFLKKYASASILLCTATQPALDFVQNKLEISTDAEVIQNLDLVVKAFKRVQVKDLATEKSFTTVQLADFVLEKMVSTDSILVVLNTKSVVKKLYQELKDRNEEIKLVHLSTAMCASHRNKILDEVRESLLRNERIILISTQLIEAGVDVSFECVIRSLAGLDSIAQAAGRCNRHGEYGIRDVYVIDHEEEKLDRLREIKVGKKVARQIFIDLKRNPNEFGGSPLSKQAMDKFFKEYYTELQSDLNYFIPKLKLNMTNLLFEFPQYHPYFNQYYRKHGLIIPVHITNSYKTAAENYRVINNLTTSAIVPYNEGEKVIGELNSYHTIDSLTRFLKEAQQFTINLYDYEKEQLSKNGLLVSYMEGKILVLKEGAYSEEYGLNLEGDSMQSLHMW